MSRVYLYSNSRRLRTVGMMLAANLLLLISNSLCSQNVLGTEKAKTVTHDGFQQSVFTTPYGIVNLFTTRDQDFFQSGKTLTGTVSLELYGENEIQKKQNLEALGKFSVSIGDAVVPIKKLLQPFYYTGSKIPASRFKITLSDGANFIQNASWSIPMSPVTSYSQSIPAGKTLFVDQNLYLDERMIALHTPCNPVFQFSDNDEFLIRDGIGRFFQIYPWAQSPATSLFKIPNRGIPGQMVIYRYRNQKLMDHVKFYCYGLELSSPNTNLKSGEESYIQSGLSPEPTKAWLRKPVPFHFTINILNTEPGIVKMDGGNSQSVSLPLRNNFYDNSAWQFKRNIIGLVPGAFSVNATLNQDCNTSNNPFFPEEQVLNEPGEFNDWLNALQNDLENYAALQQNFGQGQSIRKNVNRAIGNFRKCNDAADLQDCKSLVNEILRPLQIPKGAAVAWLSCFAGMKCAVRDMHEKINRREIFINWPLIRNGLEFIDRMAIQSRDRSIQEKADILIKSLSNEESNDPQNSPTANLYNELNDLVQKCESKISGKPLSPLNYSEKELLIATYDMLEPSAPNAVHPFRDRVGFMNPVKGLLLFLPGYQSQVMNALHGTILPNGNWRMNFLNGLGKWGVADIKPKPANPLQLMQAADTADDEGVGPPPPMKLKYHVFEKNKTGEKKPDEKKPAEKKTDEPAWPSDTQGEDSYYDYGSPDERDPPEMEVLSKIKYQDVNLVVYAHAECEKTSDARTEDCYENYDLYWNNKTGKVEKVPNGEFLKFEWPERSHCVFGTDFCLESDKTIETWYIFSDKGCNTLVKKGTVMGKGCQ